MTGQIVAPIDRSLKVLFVPNWYPHYSKGVAQAGECCREHAHAAALYDHVAVLSVRARPQKWPTLHWKVVDDSGVPTFYAEYGHSPIPKTTLPFFRLHLRRALRRVFQEWGQPDIIHTQDAYAYHVLKELSPFRIPVVISQHWTVFMERKVTPNLLKQFQWAFPRAFRVLPDNKFSPKEYDYYGIKAAVTWLPNAVDTEVFRPPQSRARKPWLLHASGMTPQKRFPDVVHAFAEVLRKHPGAVLHVAGDGPSRIEMEKLTARTLPAGSFFFHGYLSKIALSNLMQQASGFVLPSEAENLPCVLVEALASACPVLTTRVGGIMALVSDDRGLFVEVGDVRQIAESMCRLLDGTHGFDMDRISQETREQYSYASVGHILHDEYRRALGGSSTNV